MAGLYIHIPYCKQACTYCNFHFSTSLKTKADLLNAIRLELVQRKGYLAGEKIRTIYFGGGTPSLLETPEIKNILETVDKNYDLDWDSTEITLEANPDDLDKKKIKGLFDGGINRLSIGVQSFYDAGLKLMNRGHSAEQSNTGIADALQAGFTNISIDLIYGIPGQTDEQWTDSLEKTKAFGIPHFSAYSLTVEPKTALEKMIRDGRVDAPAEDQAAGQFLLLQKWAEGNGYLAYEISNYCRPGQFSKHNTAYWTGARYLGAGPSAHSFNTVSRQWNMANNALYIKNINEGKPYYEVEHLSTANRYNEYVMTTLRTTWGCDINIIKERFGLPFAKAIEESSSYYVSGKLLLKKDNVIYLTLAGKLLADKVISGLFVVDARDEG